MRQAPGRDYLTLKAFFRQLVAAVGGPKRAAEITRGHPSHISEAGAAHVADRFAALDQIYDLEVECELPIVTRALAGLHGYDLVRRQPPRSVPAAQILPRLIAECGEVQAAVAAALADGHLDDAERMAILREALDARDQIETLIETMRRPGDPL